MYTVYIIAGMSFCKTDNFEKAVKSYSRAFEADASNIKPWKGMLKLYTRTSDAAGLTFVLEHLLCLMKDSRSDPLWFDHTFNLAMLYKQHPQPCQAYTSLAKTARADYKNLPRARDVDHDHGRDDAGADEGSTRLRKAKKMMLELIEETRSNQPHTHTYTDEQVMYLQVLLWSCLASIQEQLEIQEKSYQVRHVSYRISHTHM